MMELSNVKVEIGKGRASFPMTKGSSMYWPNLNMREAGYRGNV